MHSRKLISLIGLLLLVGSSYGQQVNTYEDADAKSYELYQKAEWKNLLQFGKDYVSNAPDFLLLRLRMGYAAFMLGNYSEALSQYDAVVKKDSYNETAHIYSYLCRQYLNQGALAGMHAKYFSKELLEKEKIHRSGFTDIGAEVSYKTTQQPLRGDGLYARVDVGTRLHPNINMQHSVAIFNQTINENKLTTVNNNRNITINQKEYYNKTVINLGRNWQAIAAYHYLYTPFNNYIYNNNIGLLGIKYNSNYFTLQADAIIGKITDSSQQQYNATLALYPLGNLNLYSFSTASYSKRNKATAFNFKQVVGAKITRFLWLEANATFGNFSNFMENDALYVYNAIDKNLAKAGGTAYIALSPSITFTAGYTFEQRQLYRSTNTFYQHSITGGITCKF